MRFHSTARPVLTSLGQRLLAVSNSKLYHLENDEPSDHLWKSTLVREAVKSAWKSVEEGSQEWTRPAPSSVALDAIGEEDEEERMFEDLMNELEDEDDKQPAPVSVSEIEFLPATSPPSNEWTVEVAAVDDYEYDMDGMEAWTIALPPTPPSPALPVS
ncbi:hypothetical protein P7C73_g5538, partial [Tremellales sp. Uapishka_1]